MFVSSFPLLLLLFDELLLDELLLHKFSLADLNSLDLNSLLFVFLTSESHVFSFFTDLISIVVLLLLLEKLIFVDVEDSFLLTLLAEFITSFEETFCFLVSFLLSWSLMEFIFGEEALCVLDSVKLVTEEEFEEVLCLRFFDPLLYSLDFLSLTSLREGEEAIFFFCLLEEDSSLLLSYFVFVLLVSLILPLDSFEDLSRFVFT